MPERFASVEVAQMHFNHGNIKRSHGIPDRHRSMSVRPGIQDDPLGLLRRFPYSLYQLSLNIRLHKLEVNFWKCRLQSVIDIVEGILPVDFGFALAQMAQVDAVDY